MELHPFRFEPLLRRYLWGGRRLETVLGKSLGDGTDYAESWEIVDHGADQSCVADGPLRGMRLTEICRQHSEELFGRHAGLSAFPLLFKFLDAHLNLSVQVHPNDHQAAQLNPPDLGKTEAWVIVHAEPGSVLYAGLEPGTDRAALEREMHRQTTELCLHRIEPRVGDCFFIPAGTVHALGAGLVVAEIQQASDTTFRLFDWNRVGTDGLPRALHVEQALDVIDYSAGPVAAQQPVVTKDCEQLVTCDQFVLERWRIESPTRFNNCDRFHILSALSGSTRVAAGPVDLLLEIGQTILIPACSTSDCVLTPITPTKLLDIYLPD